MATPNWYNTMFQCFTNVRLVKFKHTIPYWYMKAILATNQDWRIYTIVSHSPIITTADEERIKSGLTTKERVITSQRILIDGEEYIDEFGRYVYLVSRVGKHADIDLRYDKEAEPELFTFEMIEHDLPDRKINSRLTRVQAR